MRTIKNITSIEQLAKYDSIIREHALILIKDQHIADELTQELYINIHKYLTKYPNKVLDGGLISVSLRNLHRNYLKYEHNRYDRGGETYEVSFPDLPDDYEDIFREKMEIENKFKIIESGLKTLNWYETKVWEYSQIMSLSELSRQSKISYTNLIRTMNKIKEKLEIIKIQE